MKAIALEGIAKRYTHVAGTLDERERRAVAAAEALTIGWGGITAVARATGLSRTAIHRGIKELEGTVPVAAPGRVRRPGGGRKRIAETDPTVLTDLERLVQSMARADPEVAARGSGASVRTLAAELRARGHRVSATWVANILRAQGNRVRGHHRTREGDDASFAGSNAVMDTGVDAPLERDLFQPSPSHP